MIRIAYDMPNLIHGNTRFIWLPEGVAGWVIRIRDIAYYFLFVLLPYLALFQWYPRKKVLYSILSIVICLPLIFLIRYRLAQGSDPVHQRLQTYFLNNLFYVLIFAVFGTVFYFVRYSHYKDLQQKELELQNRQSELSFLRSQINPHFLFNSLNNIYSLVYHGSDQALTAIAGLSELLRYMLYDSTEKVPVQKEIDYIRKYVDLQRLRFDSEIRVELLADGDLTKNTIAPLLLIPFVENAFKHGNFSVAGSGLTISLHANAKKTYFHCSNPKGKQHKDPGGGIGIENVKRRLSLLYPGRHVLVIEDGNDNFSVSLELIHE